MSFNGSGTFNINSAGQPVVSGTVISSSTFNTLTADLATGLSTCITKDGQTTVTANIPMNSYKITGLGAGTAATDAARVGQLQAGSASVVTVAGTDTYTGTMSPSLGAYAAGNTFTFVVPNTNTTAATLNIDGLGAKALTRDGSTALVAGDLVANAEVVVVYDGTRFQVLNSNSKTNFNLSGTLTVAGNTTLSGGTANGVAYLNGSKVLTTGSALTFDGTNLSVSGGYIKTTSWFDITPSVTTNNALYRATNTGGTVYLGLDNSAGGLSGAAYALNVYHTGNYPIVFSLNSAEQMRLTSTGLGIGTSSPDVKLTVTVADAVTSTKFKAATGFVRFRPYVDATNGAIIDATNAAESAYGAMTLQASTLRLFGNNASGVTIDTSGNLGLGVTPSAWASFYRGFDISTYSAVYGATTNNAGLINNGYYNGTNWIYKNTAAASNYSQSGGVHSWYNAASGTAGNAITFTAAMTLDASGNLLVGTTSQINQGLICSAYDGQAKQGIVLKDTNATLNGSFAYFINSAGTVCGNISHNATTTVAYNTTSDRRLKDNITDADSASDLIDSIKVRQFDWKADGSHQRYGMIAQELHEVAPEAVHSPVDPDDMMAVDYSKLVPMLVKEIQSLRVRLNALENK